MSFNLEGDRVWAVASPPALPSVETDSPVGVLIGPEPPAAPSVETGPGPVLAAPAAEGPSRAGGRRWWMVTATIAFVGVLTSSVFGYLLFTTSGQRDSARQRLAATSTSLVTTRQQVHDLQMESAVRKGIADYLAFYVRDSARAEGDYAELGICESFSTCRSAAQEDLTDLKAFQADRAAATVPGAFSSADGMLEDGLSAAIAAVQELIAGMDAGDKGKVEDGFHKLDAAMLSIAKAQAALGPSVK